MTNLTTEVMEKLKTPFHPSAISWKPGALTKDKTKAGAMAFVNVRMYMDVLDQVVPGEWSNVYRAWGDNKITCELTILGVTRSSTGEFDPDDAKAVAEGTSAEAQAFKRACAMFGLGRYLYRLQAQWVAIDEYKKFTKESKAELDSYYSRFYAKAMAAVKTPIQPIVEDDMEEVAPDVAQAKAAPVKAAAVAQPAPAKAAPAPTAPAPKAAPVAQPVSDTDNGSEPWATWKNKLDMIKFAEKSGMSNADANELFKGSLMQFKGYNPNDAVQAAKVHEHFYGEVQKATAA